MQLGDVITALGFLITISTFIFALGKRDSKIDVLEKRQEEDRSSNKEQHKEFYACKYMAEVTNGNVSRLDVDMREIKSDIKKILSRIPARSEEEE
jgi:hypothetical protein